MRKENRVEEMSMLLKERLEEWRLRNNDPEYRPKPVVTVTREPGCGGESIAERIAAELGMHLYNWELVERIARDASVDAKLVSKLEEDPATVFEDYLGGLISEYRREYHFSSEEYLDSLKRVLLAIALPGNAVIVGRGSNFFLPRENKIGLCLVAPLSVRIENVMKELGLTEKDARKHISRLEAEHRKLAKRYFQADIREPDCYHLVVNTALIKPETIVQMIRPMIQESNEAKQETKL